jgi:hypothetical protein
MNLPMMFLNAEDAKKDVFHLKSLKVIRLKRRNVEGKMIQM